MAGAQKQSARTLFNDSTLSDVKVRQIFDGQNREYFAHKAVLCSQSEFFMNAFTGSFKEANEATIDIYDDDPDHFEFALRFMYTQKFDVDAISVVIGKDDKVKMAQFSKGVHIIADKYSIQHLIVPATTHLQITLESITEIDDLSTLVTAQYSNCSHPGDVYGARIVSTLFRHHHRFTTSDEFGGLCQTYPAFASDIMSALRRFRCSSCEKFTAIAAVHTETESSSLICTHCSAWNTLTA